VGYIAISLGTRTVTFRGIIGGFKPPRVRSAMPEIERSASGNTIVRGAVTELPHLWEFQSVLSKPDWLILEAIAFDYDERRRNFQDFKMLLTDTFFEHIERAPRTRATAPAPLNQVTTIGDSISYYAQFYALFAKMPEAVQTGRLSNSEECVVVSVILEEDVEKVSPT
jgi:hypothetical protein